MSRKKNLAHIFGKDCAEHQCTVEEVRRDMEAAIRAGFHHPNHKVQVRWAGIP